MMSTFGQARALGCSSLSHDAALLRRRRTFKKLAFTAAHAAGLRRGNVSQVIAYATVAWALLALPLFVAVQRLVAAALRRWHKEGELPLLRGRPAKSP